MRIFTDGISGDKYVLKGDSHRHVAYSLRSKVGDEITLCPQDGFDYIGRISAIEKERTTVSVEKKVPSIGEPRTHITVFFGVPNKGDKLDLTVQKLTELGVSEMQPIMTEYVQGRADSVRVERLARICEEAAKQCGRGKIPKVNAPSSFSDTVKRLGEYDLVVFPYERERKLSLKDYLHGVDADRIKTVAVIIGSEGGFSEREAAELRSRGVLGVTLGTRILRTETANIAVVAALAYELGEWSYGDSEESK